MSISSITRVELFPSNRPSINNEYSYKDGNPTLQFVFSENDSQYLLSNTIKLNFGVQLFAQNASHPNNDDQNGSMAGSNVQHNSFIGSGVSVIQSISISNNINNQLEYVRDYPRLLASMLPMTANFKTYATLLDSQYSATSNDQAAALKQNNRQEVSMPLLCGLFLNGTAIPMGGQNMGTGGLTISIQLSASIKSNFGAGGGLGPVGTAAGSYYKIYNPTITAAMGNVAGGLPKIKSMPYNSFSAYYGTLNNSDETINIPTGLSSVLAQFSNFVPTTHIANDTMDGFSTPSLRNSPYGPTNYAPITNYSCLKANLLYPLRFPVNEEQNVTTNPGGLFEANYTAQRQRNFLNAMRPISSNKSLLSGNVSETTIATIPAAGTQAKLRGTQNTPGAQVTGVGCRYDMLNAGSGANFSKGSYSHRIRSRLDGRSSNSIFTFFLHKNVVNYTSGGITVAS